MGSAMLPSRITIRVFSDGTPLAGALVMLRFKSCRKNDFELIAGPTDAQGEVIVDRDQIALDAALEQKLFPMDFGRLETDFAGVLTVWALSLGDIDRALAAFRLFKEVSRYPPSHETHLNNAKRILNRHIGAVLSVESQTEGPACMVQGVTKTVA